MGFQMTPEKWLVYGTYMEDAVFTHTCGYTIMAELDSTLADIVPKIEEHEKECKR